MMTHRTGSTIRMISGRRSPATVRPLSLIVSLVGARIPGNDVARQRIADAHAEAERLWRASIVAAAQLATPQDRLEAFERARDVAFTLWCVLAAIDGSDSDPSAS